MITIAGDNYMGPCDLCGSEFHFVRTWITDGADYMVNEYHCQTPECTEIVDFYGL
jgi:hypothetical protein